MPEQRFTVGLASVPFHFVRRPISVLPEKEKTVAILDGISAKGNPCRSAGCFHDGKWWASAGFQKLRFEPTSWTVIR